MLGDQEQMQLHYCRDLLRAFAITTWQRGRDKKAVLSLCFAPSQVLEYHCKCFVAVCRADDITAGRRRGRASILIPLRNQ